MTDLRFDRSGARRRFARHIEAIEAKETGGPIVHRPDARSADEFLEPMYPFTWRMRQPSSHGGPEVSMDYETYLRTPPPLHYMDRPDWHHFSDRYEAWKRKQDQAA